MATDNKPDPLGMSDDDFLNMNSAPEVTATPTEPAQVEQESEQQEEQQEEQHTEKTQEELDAETAALTDAEKHKDDIDDDDPDGEVETEISTAGKEKPAQVIPKEGEQGKPAATTKTVAPKGKDGQVEGTEGDKPTGSEAKPAATTPDYTDFYKKVMAPFKANGKTIELKSPDEAIQLMQMGANYTRKMQSIKPHQKLLLMLENNGLLDEDKLSYLIDIDKKNPEAIKKMIKDSGIDPLDIDTSVEPSYHQGNHRVTDEEAGFRTALDELGSNPEGKATLQEINSWDQASKEVLWSSPEIMALIHVQRENGVYGRITTEVERQRLLGQIPAQVPFLEAYKTVGDQLAKTNSFNDLVKPAVTKTPVATRAAVVKPAVTNGGKVSAASPTRSSPRNKASTTINHLAMDDDEFIKQMDNRL